MKSTPAAATAVRAEDSLSGDVPVFLRPCRSATQGRATYSMEFKHYSEVPKIARRGAINS
jgi:hypothetical protein